MVPQPKRSLAPVPQNMFPGPDCRLVKKSPGAAFSPPQPLGAWALKSSVLEQTCHPGAQRSATLHPAPLGLSELLPAP